LVVRRVAANGKREKPERRFLSTCHGKASVTACRCCSSSRLQVRPPFCPRSRARCPLSTSRRDGVGPSIPRRAGHRSVDRPARSKPHFLHHFILTRHERRDRPRSARPIAARGLIVTPAASNGSGPSATTPGATQHRQGFLRPVRTGNVARDHSRSLAKVSRTAEMDDLGDVLGSDII
jgi:hypothetical protein